MFTARYGLGQAASLKVHLKTKDLKELNGMMWKNKLPVNYSNQKNAHKTTKDHTYVKLLHVSLLVRRLQEIQSAKLLQVPAQ